MAKFTNTPIDNHHFFGTSLGRWMVAESYETVVKSMKQDGMTFEVWSVPGGTDAAYEIRMFAPQVEGARRIAHYEVEGD